MSNQHAREATFAGTLFVLSQDERHLITCDAPTPAENATVRITATFAVPVRDAFLLSQTGRWVLVGGWNDGTNRRASYFDDSAERDQNARSLMTLGIPVLGLDEANANVQRVGLHIDSITAVERTRQAAALRDERREMSRPNEGDAKR